MPVCKRYFEASFTLNCILGVTVFDSVLSGATLAISVTVLSSGLGVLSVPAAVVVFFLDFLVESYKRYKWVSECSE